MPKRKRGEPSLEDNLAKWRKELVRGLKAAKGFERQRLSKRLREADPEKTARLEKEVLVLKVSRIDSYSAVRKESVQSADLMRCLSRRVSTCTRQRMHICAHPF